MVSFSRPLTLLGGIALLVSTTLPNTARAADTPDPCAAHDCAACTEKAGQDAGCIWCTAGLKEGATTNIMALGLGFCIKSDGGACPTDKVNELAQLASVKTLEGQYTIGATGSEAAKTLSLTLNKLTLCTPPKAVLAMSKDGTTCKACAENSKFWCDLTLDDKHDTTPAKRTGSMCATTEAKCADINFDLPTSFNPIVATAALGTCPTEAPTTTEAPKAPGGAAGLAASLGLTCGAVALGIAAAY